MYSLRYTYVTHTQYTNFSHSLQWAKIHAKNNTYQIRLILVLVDWKVILLNLCYNYVNLFSTKYLPLFSMYLKRIKRIKEVKTVLDPLWLIWYTYLCMCSQTRLFERNLHLIFILPKFLWMEKPVICCDLDVQECRYIGAIYWSTVNKMNWWIY